MLWIWLLGSVLLWGASGMVWYRRRNHTTALCCAVLVMAAPVAHVLWQCRQDAVSEACVWGKAYLGAFYFVAGAWVLPLGFLVCALLGSLYQKLRAKG